MKKKHIIAITILAVVYVATALTLKYRYEYKKEHEICEGFTISSNKRPIKMAMKSDTDIFKVDDVSFDIYYGMYDEGSDSPKYYYTKESSEEPFLVMYIYDYECRLKDESGGDIYDDYKKIKDYYYYIKEIPEDEAFSGEYAYVVKKNRIEYKHCERITIQKDLFNKSEGEVAIELSSFVPMEDGKFRGSYRRVIILRYKYLNDDTVRLEYVHH